MAAGKRIVLAVIEAITVPEELARLPAVDMRAWGGAPWAELARVIAGGECSTPTTLERLRVPKPIAIPASSLVLLFFFQVLLAGQWIFDAGKVLAWCASLGRKVLTASHLAIIVCWIAWTTRWSWAVCAPSCNRVRSSENGRRSIPLDPSRDHLSISLYRLNSRYRDQPRYVRAHPYGSRGLVLDAATRISKPESRR